MAKLSRPLTSKSMYDEDNELEIKRNPQGYIESVRGVDEDGYPVTFAFKRDGKQQLEKIEMRDE